MTDKFINRNGVYPPCMDMHLCEKCKYSYGYNGCSLMEAYFNQIDDEDELDHMLRVQFARALTSLYHVFRDDIMERGIMPIRKRGYTIKTPDKTYEVMMEITERDRR